MAICDYCGQRAGLGQSTCPECSDRLSKGEVLRPSRKVAEAKMRQAESSSASAVSTEQRSSAASDGDVARAHHTTTSTETAVMRRYRDAYAVATHINWMGNLVKGVAVAVAVLITAAGVMIHQAPAALGLGLLFGLAIFGLGIAIAAQGQILLASLDTAVNSSPHLSNTQKAQAIGV